MSDVIILQIYIWKQNFIKWKYIDFIGKTPIDKLKKITWEEKNFKCTYIKVMQICFLRQLHQFFFI